MAIVYQAGSELNKALADAGQSIGSVISDVSQRRTARKHDTILSSVFDKLPPGATSQDYIEAGREAIAEGVPQEKVAQYSKNIAELRKSDPKPVISKKEGNFLDGLNEKEIESTLKDLGLSTSESKNWARFYNNATEGGKTQITKAILDMKSRGDLGEKTNLYARHEPAAKGRDPEHKSGYMMPTLSEIDPWTGLKPSDVVRKREQNRRLADDDIKQTSRFFATARKKEFAMRKLQQLEDRGNLPEYIGRANIASDGSLRIPSLADPDAEEFVKVINDFQTDAKDTFGARVTNFELDRFMTRLPGLVNSPQGRQQIYDYMNKVHQIEKDFHEARRDVLNYYGTDVLDPFEVDKIANEIVERKDAQLIEEVNNLNNLENFPEGRDQLVNEPKKQENKHPEVGIKKGNIEVIGPKGQIKQMPNTPELRNQLKKWEGWNIRE